MKKDTIEKDDRYVLPLDNRVVSRCYFDNAFGIQFFEDGPEATIRIGDDFLIIKNNTEQKLSLENIETLGTVLSIIGKSVVTATAFKDGRLEINFNNGLLLRVEVDSKYESWEFSDTEGRMVVSLPGGGLSIWNTTEGK